MDPKVFNIIRRVQAEQDQVKRAELMASTNGEMSEHFMRHPNDMEELAFDLFNQAFADVQNGDLVNQLIDVRTVGLGEMDYIEEDLRGMRAYFQGKGGQITSYVLRAERAPMPREELVSAIDMHQDEVLLDFWGALGKLIAQIQEKIRTAPAYKLVEMVQAAIVTGPTYLETSVGAFTDDTFDPVIDEVARRSRGQVVIYGTNIAIRKLANIGLEFGDNVKEQIFRTGVIGTYKGYPVAQLEQFEDFEGRFVLPDDELVLLGRNAGRLTWYGNQAKVQQLKLPSFYFRWETARDVGLSLYGAAKGRVGRVKFT